jgi:TPR repeat protein
MLRQLTERFAVNSAIDFSAKAILRIRKMADDSYDFEYAWVLFKSKDFARAREYVLAHANEGDSNAQCMMGFLCEHGFGASRDVQEAERWLRKAAEQNNAVAWNNLGTLLLGKGETEKAKGCYGKAVELGFTMAAPLAQ